MQRRFSNPAAWAGILPTQEQRQALAAVIEPDRAYLSPDLRATIASAQSGESWVDADYRRIG